MHLRDRSKTMNPFLFDTVAKPLNKVTAKWHHRSPTHYKASPSNKAIHYKTWNKAVKIVGLTALSWMSSVNAVDLNSANLNELKGIKGIGPKTAQIIIDERNRAGAYQSFSDLSDRVRGIGPKKAQALQASGLTISKTATQINPKSSLKANTSK